MQTKTELEQETALRQKMRGESDVSPEDTLTELRDDVKTVELRDQMKGVPGVSPADTRTELLDEQARAAEKEASKERDAAVLKQERIDAARRMTEEQAKQQAEKDTEEHASILASGPKWELDAFYLRNDMAERMKANAAYAAALAEKAPELAKRVEANERENVTVNVAANIAKSMDTQEAVKTAGRDIEQHEALMALGTNNGTNQAEILRIQMRTRQGANTDYAAALAEKAPELAKRIEAEAAQATVNKALEAQIEDDLRRRKAREAEQAGQGLNTVDVQRSGRELERGEFIMPRQIAKNYNEVDGKFFTKDKERPLVMFEDQGDKLATSTTDKKAIADMVMLAKAKQWDSLKLTGSQEFRREAWLQAESQGIKTQGYTPKQSDLAALEALREERSTNSITPVQERKAVRETQQQSENIKAPRHDLNKNQAALHTEATKLIATNMQALQKQPAFADRSVEDLTKLAYWRGIVSEENKRQPQGVQEEALARFDKQAQEPKFLQRLERETRTEVQEKTTERVTERVNSRATHEQSL